MQDQGAHAQKFWESLNTAAHEAPLAQDQRVLVPFYGTQTRPGAGRYVGLRPRDPSYGRLSSLPGVDPVRSLEMPMLTRSPPKREINSAPKAASKAKTSVQPMKQRGGQANDRFVSVPSLSRTPARPGTIGTHELLCVQASAGHRKAVHQSGDTKANHGFERQDHAAQAQQSSAPAFTHAAVYFYAEEQSGCVPWLAVL